MGGHAVEITEDGDEVLARCASGEIDAVVMDVSLASTRVEGERLDGVRLIRLLEERCPGGRPPVLLMTAHAMRGDRSRLLAASGAEDYIAKPIVDHHELVDRVSGLLRRGEIARDSCPRRQVRGGGRGRTK